MYKRQVYIYYYNTTSGLWIQDGRLKAWDGNSDDRFGSSVSIYQSGSRYYALGSSHFHSQEKGAVYLFGRYGNSWNPLQKFMPDELQNKVTNDNFIGDLFGQSVSVNNDSIWCSAPNRDISGTLFIFRETVSYTSEDILINQNPDSNYDFPQSTIVKQYSNLTDYDTRVPNNYYLNRSRLNTTKIDPINFLHDPSGQWLRITVYQNATLDSATSTIDQVWGWFGNFTTVSDAIVTDSDPIVYWKMDNLTVTDSSRPQTRKIDVGGNMIDVLVSSSNATIQGSLESVWGLVNDAVQFNGSSFITLDDSQPTVLDDSDNIISLGSKLNLFSSLTAYTICLLYTSPSPRD